MLFQSLTLKPRQPFLWKLTSHDGAVPLSSKMHAVAELPPSRPVASFDRMSHLSQCCLPDKPSTPLQELLGSCAKAVTAFLLNVISS